MKKSITIILFIFTFFSESMGGNLLNKEKHSAGFYLDLVRIEHFRIMIDKKPFKISEVKDKSIILKIVTFHNKIPNKGAIYMKLAPTSSLYKIKYFNNGKLIKTIKIYNNRVQCENTAFPGEKYQDAESSFVKLIREISEK